MTVKTVASCDECGERNVSTSITDGFDRNGWIEVWGYPDDENCLDFCCQQCLVDYFTKEEPDA